MKNDNPMYEKYVTISWCPADIKSIRPEWSDEKCMEALDEISGVIEDNGIQNGWNAMEQMLTTYYPEDKEY